MGYYIETDDRINKGNWLMKNVSGTKRILPSEAETLFDNNDIIVVMHNGLFEAAGFAFDRDELRSFLRPDDLRPKECFALPKGTGAKLSGFIR